MKKYSLKVLIKSAAITLSVFIFFGALFCAMNNTQNTLNGNAVSVVRTTDGWIFNTYQNSYRVQMDSSCFGKALRQFLALLLCPLRPYNQGFLLTPVTSDPSP